MSDPYFFGADLGGTRLRVGLVTSRGELATDLASVPTGPAFGPDELERQITKLTAKLRGSLNGHRVQALGFGTAGVVRPGPLTQSHHLPLLNGVDITELIRGAVQCPVAFENDARCFTLAEARYGAARGARDVCGITLGTGVGCGVLLDGRLHRGAASQAGEVWRSPLRERHLEYFLSGAGVVRGYEAAAGRRAAAVDAARVAQLADAGDEAALAAWHRFGEDLAVLCEWIMSLFDPAVIVIGGSLSQAFLLYRTVLTSRLDGGRTRIAPAQLGQAAGVIGAAALNIE